MLRSGSRKGFGISLVLVVLVVFGILSVISPDDVAMSMVYPVQDNSPFPRKIWQIFFNPRDSTFEYPHSTNLDILHDTRSWIGLNPGYQYKLMGIGLESGDDFVIKHFSHYKYKSIMDTYFALRNPGLKTDLLRYLILWIEGGIYSDLDTWAFKPVDAWVPEYMKGQVGAIVGIEWDQLGGDPWPAFDNGPSDMTHEVQFCQWTLAGAAGHPLFKNAAMMSVERIAALAAARQESITDLDPTGHVRQGIAPSFFCPVTFPLVFHPRSLPTHQKHHRPQISCRRWTLRVLMGLTPNRKLSLPLGHQHGQMWFSNTFTRWIRYSQSRKSCPV